MNPPRIAPLATASLLLFLSVRGTADPSRFGVLTSSRWAYGARYERGNLVSPPNDHPGPEPQPTRLHPFDVEVSRDGSKVYVGLLGSELEPGDSVAVYGVREDRILKRIRLKRPEETGPPASGPYRLALHPDGKRLFVTNRYSNFASVIDTGKDEVADELPLDFYCQGMAFSPSGDEAYFANRYLDQILVADSGAKTAPRALGGADDQAFFDRVHGLLVRRCGGCHADPDGQFYAGADVKRSFFSALSHLDTARPEDSRLLRAPAPSSHGGYGDALPRVAAHAGSVVFIQPDEDEDFKELSRWVRSASPGPGIPVGNPRSKPKVLAVSGDGRRLYVGNTGTQDVSVVDLENRREIGSIHVQNVVNDLKIYRPPGSRKEFLLVSLGGGAGFGVARERDPFGAESPDAANAAAHFSVYRDTRTGRVLSKERQDVLGPFDAVDGTAGIKFRDIQNDLLIIDLSLVEEPPEGSPPRRLLSASRYEAHRAWVRYTSDTAESTYGDLKGDIPPELMRVVGGLPERMALDGRSLFVTMQGSHRVQEWELDTGADDPAFYLKPVRTLATGLMPMGVALGRAGTVSDGLLFTANFLGGTLTVADRRTGNSREVVVDPSVISRPVPDTNAERGELFAHSAVFSSDGDTSCIHCHYLDMGDGRPWGVSQMLGQEYMPLPFEAGQFVIGGTMSVPQMRGLFHIQPFFFEGTLSVYEPRSMIMEHSPADDFSRPAPSGDYTALEAHYVQDGVDDVQSSMDAATNIRSTLEERRDEMFRDLSRRFFGKAFVMRDFQRFVGEWQAHETRLLPNPYDPASPSVRRGKEIFERPQVGCASCHPAPHFAKKDFPDNPTQSMPPVVTTSVRDGAFTLIGMNKLDAINGVARDLEPADEGRSEAVQANFTTFPLRGIWDRPPVFLHNGLARTLREVVATPGHKALRRLKYPPRLGEEVERPGGFEVGFNETGLYASEEPRRHVERAAGARLGLDTHGGTSHLSPRDIDDLVNYLRSIQ